jgi:catechol 2,3-dioxygenase-like lactoylglutathione lyase family enzyme
MARGFVRRYFFWDRARRVPEKEPTMNNTLISDVKSVVLTSQTPDATARFYRDVLQLPLEEEQHRGTARHWACQLGNIHFAIHEQRSFWLPSTAAAEPPATVVSFTVNDLDAFLAHLATCGLEVVARTNIGPMKFIALRDPDGRNVCCGTPWPRRAAQTPSALDG